jgi:glycosyltransferase involved in cell wall biosynthesis
VSIAVTLYNYEREVLRALRSVAASQFADYEVLIVDDASTDASLAGVVEFASDHPWMALSVRHSRCNRGLGASRNALIDNARGEFLFVLDADNTIYPTALGRLVEALDRDPGASFSYPMLAVTRADDPVDLLSHRAWDPEGFRGGNYIDAMALIRLDDLITFGGYTENVRLTGWEDFDLWCRCAEAGGRGRLVPEVLAEYRQTSHSMLATIQTDVTVAWSVMHARFPSLVGAAPGP